MKSIKKRLMINFMLVIFISVLFLEILLINFVKQYYYKNVEDVLTNQIMISSEFYTRYFSNASLEDNILDNVDVFWKQTPAQVQIIDLSGKVLMDSIGVGWKEHIHATDIKKALDGKKGVWTGKVDYDDHKVMAVAYPLKADNKIVGVLRFITSLEEVNNGIKRISMIFLSIGAFVTIISGIVSIFLANTITIPIEELTNTAKKMALGNFKVRSRKKYDDEIGKLSDTLNFMADEIVKKDQLKNEFISSVSHEIRTPLTAIKGWALVLNNQELNDKETMREGLKIIEKESERLTLMVEELLDFSKFVSGKITLNKEKVIIEDLVKYIEKYMRPRASRDKINFMVDYDKDIPPMFMDKNRIKQVLINVLDNAFKFTDKGGMVSFYAKLEKNELIMSIKDNGCGISSEDLPKVKEKFYKGKNSKSKNGIGLSICDEIVKLHEGSLDIESELNKGTIVNIRLPIESFI
ncbi:cell wall metabolism sensor histidine kinase WalK [Crassaminicella thermophila]|uniref:histidine kinase n=1 Tax=Crassaminicella thermophila TaxID=2599308 RepID=A0A5C0SB92_CRATE|nr:ATP-binding protein [Crassaminicella thermophila]QEK11885.1 cell wall metabolism sensor histidine kinase WalK [Crassaminicella thermophila]